MGFIDTMRSQGHGVESVCRVLREQGCQVAARTYRAWRRARASVRDLADAYLMSAIIDICHTVGSEGVLVPTPASLYGRPKMVAHLRRLGWEVSHTQVARCLKLLATRESGDP